MAEHRVVKRVDEEVESGHGTLTPVDQQYSGERFVGLIAATLAAALVIIYLSASFNPDDTSIDFSWQGWGLAHDPVHHSLESSTMDIKLH
jgi:hypothetical protein